MSPATTPASGALHPPGEQEGGPCQTDITLAPTQAGAELREAMSRFFLSNAVEQIIPARSERSSGFRLQVVQHSPITPHGWDSLVFAPPPEDPGLPALPARSSHPESTNNACSPDLPAGQSVSLLGQGTRASVFSFLSFSFQLPGGSDVQPRFRTSAAGAVV